MRKIVKQLINQDFLPFSPKRLDIGDVLDFDCYIKRFNGYVIIIEAGTEITESLMEKIRKHSYIYVGKSQVELYQAYSVKKVQSEADHAGDMKCDFDEFFRRLADDMEACANLDEKMALLYPAAVDMMACYFGTQSEELPLKYIEQYSDALITLLEEHTYDLEDFLVYMPDQYTDASHNVNVSLLSVLLGKELRLSNLQLKELAIAGILHDIGKLKIDQKILQKDVKLESDEFEVIQEHPVLSVEIAKYNGMVNPKVLQAIRYHHEKLDGSGYPEGISGNHIPLMAQILGTCDIFDALTTDRVFRARYSSFEALKLMKTEMAHQLNLKHVDTFIKLLKH